MRLSVPPPGYTAEFPDFITAVHPDGVEYPVIAGLDRYPDFCEERFVADLGDPADMTIPANVLYHRCLAITGYAVDEYIDTGGALACRLLYPINCSAGMYRSTRFTCQAVQRRSWTCPVTYIPRNEFNTCYFVPPPLVGANPACAAGAP